MTVVLARRPGSSYYQSTVVAIGNFDGLHLGHQALLQNASVILTFDPYPQAYFHPERKIPRLTTLREKSSILEKFSPELIYALPFNHHLAHLSPSQFIEEILLKKLNAKKVIVGNDFKFGYQRKGTIETLKNYLEVEAVSPVLYQDKRISSTWVRETLAKGDVNTAQYLLGRYYSMIGRVVKGDGRGRQMGVRTANISLQKRLPPLRGVYGVNIIGIGRGVANIGSRPTVDGTRNFLEVHIFDFNRDIYGEYIEVEFTHKLRDEKKFDSLNDLQEQIKLDIQHARDLR